MITSKRLRELIMYDPLNGSFTWKVNRGRNAKIGQSAGTMFEGYLRIKIDGVSYLAHRLAWLYTYNKWPENEIDHKNMQRSDNRLSNLREATLSQNRANARARKNRINGVLKGAHKTPYGRWMAIIIANKKRLYLGCFDTEQEANLAYLEAAKKHFGEFAREK